MLQWILDIAVPRRSTDEEISQRIMIVNFVAIFTSSSVRE